MIYSTMGHPCTRTLAGLYYMREQYVTHVVTWFRS
jgi:hypothetical protein